MKLSVVIPAYNEENYLPRTMSALRAALESIDDAEVVVVDNGSTDLTREIAESHDARVVDEHERNIGKVRNTGAEVASGDVIVFIDADTRVRPGVFEKIVEAMSDEHCFGGSVAVEYDHHEKRPWMKYYLGLAIIVGRLIGMRQGALQFCRREIFHELGGYDTTIYVGEDVEFHWRLDKLAAARGGHTAFIEEPKVITSNRRFEKMSLWRTIIFTHPITIFLGWRVRALWKDWYENAVR